MSKDQFERDTATGGDAADDELARLRRANVELETRLGEAEDTLAAIRNGDVDALIVGEDIYTLDSAQAATNAMRKDVLAQMQDAVLAFDVDDHVIYMNPAAESQYGCSATEMLGRERGELFRERWPDAERAMHARESLRSTGSYRAESVHVRRDGHEMHVECTVSLLEDGAREPLGTMSVIRNIDERAQSQATLALAAAALAQRERQFATLVENSPDIFSRFDRDLRHLYVSPVVERYTGVPAAAYLGRSAAEMGMMPDVQSEWERAVRRVFETGAVGAIKFRFSGVGGQAWMFSSRLIPEFADDGEVESVLSIASNITEQEMIDAALRESKARLEFTLAAAHVGEWEIDVDSGESRHSDLYDRCFGYAAPVPGWNLETLYAHLHADDRERVRALVTRAFATRTDLAFEARVVWPDASEHWIDVHGSPYVSARASERESPRLRFLGIIADITLRKHTEATLHDADLRKDEFLATLAHELRNPLAPIRNAVQIMQLSRDETMHGKARKIIERQLRQMVHLVDDLLDVSRISQGKVELRREQVDVADAVSAAIETSRPLIDAGRHHLTTRLAPPRALMVDADTTRLSQIVANLLNNAAKYTPEGGHIQVLAERDGDDAVISVQDSGIGLSADMLPRVFDLFTQADRSRERAQGGLGIGLALVKRLVEMHGGAVHATSDGPDRGCRFVVRLPLIRVPARAPRLDAGHELIAQDTDGLRVLVVDDNVDSAESLSQVMQILGYPVAVGHDGVEAVEMATNWRPAVALLDIGMPRMNGLEAARAIRALPEGDRPWLIALSGWGQSEDRRKSREAGFDHHFVKPVDVEALIELIRKLPKR
ncbi:PAS domain S-box protein [Scleromatobacter humisilvae]|uniref:histidine kinase n=1 Tax=Scleromatobacter humisilvae TaxID=2897159 RepID=A0A9X1YEZ0_9BURK|nr:PAS domain S-box protein [Scleromatobacter humisilvae]MCK9685094.1 PAS domain S-box protein [Scleromatobacter humisilvae]